MAMVRIDLGITQQELGDTVGVSRQWISMAEGGTRRMPPRAMEYLQKLMEIASQNPPAAAITKRKRPSVATQRPPYNRVRFSARSGNLAIEQIATLNRYRSVLSKEELQLTGERLKERMRNSGQKDPTALGSNRELLCTLEQKFALTKARLEVEELEKAAAPGRALDIKANLLSLKAKLKAHRETYKKHPPLRKQHRSKIARLYVKKLNLQEQLEKFNRTSMVKRKQVINEIKGALKDQEALAATIRKAIEKMEQQGVS